MAREKKIVDASVIVKWFVDEEDSDRALALREEHRRGDTLLVIPEIALAEVINALRYKHTDFSALQEAIKSLWDVQLHVEHLSSDLLAQASKLALQYKLSIYDALYAALATRFGCTLITADETLAKAPNAMLL